MEKENQQFDRMTKTPIPRLVGRLAVPTVISMLVSAIYNMADTYFVSQLGTSASAAVGVVFSLMSLIQAAGFGIGMGAGSLISRALGRKETDLASTYASSAFLSAFLFGLVLMAAGLANIQGLMCILGSTVTILPYACAYGQYILIGAPIMCCSYVMNNVLRAQGRASLSMIGLSLGGVLNIALDPLFIFTLGLNTAGAAIATIISQAISFTVLFSFFLHRKSEARLNPKFISVKPSTYGEILRCGFPTVCRQGCASIASALLNLQAAPFGDAAVAAMSIANRIYLFVRNIIIGIGQGYQPVVGYNYGAKKFDRVRSAFWFSVKASTIICIVAAILVAWQAESLMALFRRDDAQVISYGATALYFLCAQLPFLSYSTYVNQLLQCLGFSGRATFLAACRQGIFYIPLILILPSLFGMTGIELTQPLSDMFTFFLSIPFHVAFVKQLNRLESEK